MATESIYLRFLCTLIFIRVRAEGEEFSTENTGIPTGLGLRQLWGTVIAVKKVAPLLLDCGVVADASVPIQEYRWFKNGEPVPLDNRVKLHQNNGTLHFKKVQKRTKNGRVKSDEGSYACHVQNKYGVVIARHVKVKIADLSRTFTEEPTSQEASVGGIARFHCQIDAVPPARYIWNRNDVALTLNERITKLASGVLQIMDVQEEDAGVYQCIANRGAIDGVPDTLRNTPKWRRSSTANLTVKKESVDRSPRIIGRPVNTTVMDGDTVILECLTDGQPKPLVTWRRQDGIGLFRDNVTQMPNGNLKFTHVEPKDFAVYICDGVNGMGQGSRAVVNLTVIAPPVMRSELSKQSFTQKFSMFARLHCSAKGIPKPTIKWYKDGQEIQNSGKVQLVEPVKNLDRLLASKDVTITGGDVSHSGYYQCFVENEAGSVTGVARINITKNEHEPEWNRQIHFRDVTATSVVISWNLCEPCIVYSVGYQDISQQGSAFDHMNSDHSKQKELLLDSLEPYTTYSINVQPFTSNIVLGESETIQVLTSEKVPSDPPDFKLSQSSRTSLLVKWNALRHNKARGLINKHKVFCNDNVIEILGTNITEYHLKDLQPGREYNIRVLAGNSQGYPANRPQWMSYKLLDNELDATAPVIENLMVVPLSLTAVEVSWKLMPQKAPVSNYTMFLTKADGKDHPHTTINVPGNVTRYVLRNLGMSTYELSLLPNNRDGILSRMVEEMFQTRTDIDKFPPPVKLYSSALGSRTISLKWQQPNTKLNIDYYNIRYHTASTGNSNDMFLYIESRATEVVIENLEPYTLYELAVRSHTKARSTPYSKTTSVRTKEDKPSAPKNVIYQIIAPGQIRLNWEPPMQPNGKIDKYVVLYSSNQEQPAKYWHIKKLNGPETTVIMSNLKEDVYYFRVRACNKAGNGSLSQVVVVKDCCTNGRNPLVVETTTVAIPSPVFPQKLTLIIGVVTGVTCIIVCVIIILCRKKCCVQAAGGRNISQEPMANGSVHHPGNGQAGMGYPETYALEDQSYTPMLTQLPENQNADAKGGGNLILSANGRPNGYCISGTGTNGHYPNGHVTSFITARAHQDADREIPPTERCALLNQSGADGNTCDRIQQTLNGQTSPDTWLRMEERSAESTHKKSQPITSHTDDAGPPDRIMGTSDRQQQQCRTSPPHISSSVQLRSKPLHQKQQQKTATSGFHDNSPVSTNSYLQPTVGSNNSPLTTECF